MCVHIANCPLGLVFDPAVQECIIIKRNPLAFFLPYSVRASFTVGLGDITQYTVDTFSSSSPSLIWGCCPAERGDFSLPSLSFENFFFFCSSSVREESRGSAPAVIQLLHQPYIPHRISFQLISILCSSPPYIYVYPYMLERERGGGHHHHIKGESGPLPSAPTGPSGSL